MRIGSCLVSVWLTALSSGCLLPEVTEAPAADAAENCLACAETACPDAFHACFESPDCEMVATCVLSCEEGDQACAGGCAAGGQGVDEALALTGCTDTACASECPVVGLSGM